MSVGAEEQPGRAQEEIVDPAYVSTEELGVTDTAFVPSWEEVKAKVDDGRLTLAEGAATRCASATADLYYNVGAVRSFADRNTNCDLPLSSLPEGKAFADRLAVKRVEFLEILDKVLDNVRLRHETFIDAGNLLEKVDAAAAESFALQEFAYTPPPAAELVRGASLVDEGGPWDADPLFIDNFHPPNPATEPEDGVTSHTEVELTTTGFINPILLDPSAAAYVMTYELGEYIRNNSLFEYATNLASSWGQVGTVLNSIFEDYVDVIRTVTAEDWQGKSSAAGFAAVEGDEKGIINCAPGPFGMRDLCSYLAHWFQQAAEQLPTDPDVPKTQTIVPDTGWQLYTPASYVWVPHYSNDGYFFEEVDENLVNYYLGVMEETYTGPMEKADAGVPVLPEFMTGSSGTPATDPYVYESDPYPYGGTGGYAGSGGLEPAGTTSSVLPDYSSSTDDLAAQQEEWARAQDEAAKQQALQSMLGQGLSAAQNALDQGLAMAQRAMESAAQPLDPSMVPAAPSGLDLGENSSFGPGALGGGAGLASTATGAGAPKSAYDASKLFPRAGVAPGSTNPLAAGASPAGMQMGGSPMAGTPGMPGSAGAPGAGARPGQDDKHERAKYLDRTDNLDDALGDAPDMTRAVVGEGVARSATGQPSAAPVPSGPERPAAPIAPTPVSNQLPPQRQVVRGSD
ncbi:hypothetical protein [Nocardia sp. NBC_00416]|uniref:hypothetical protein n=1 Tax=Nocardia sp. NBC_00416 TaxID=2975991 RepID=UPI002E1ADB26